MQPWSMAIASDVISYQAISRGAGVTSHMVVAKHYEWKRELLGMESNMKGLVEKLKKVRSDKNHRESLK